VDVESVRDRAVDEYWPALEEVLALSTATNNALTHVRKPQLLEDPIF
jgi:hypothetical protein